MINADKPSLWKGDVEKSIDFYNDWFIRFAPETYRSQRSITTSAVLDAFAKTANLTRVVPAVLREAPGILAILRMITAPPLARDRLMGLSHVSKSLIIGMEGQEGSRPRLPKRLSPEQIEDSLLRLCDVLTELIDEDLVSWVSLKKKPSRQELDRAATVIADRMCGTVADPIIRNAQEKRQLATLKRWLKRRGYREIPARAVPDPSNMAPGTFTFHLNLSGGREESRVRIPIDCVIGPQGSASQAFPILIEAKSAGDATNTNKRRKEEAQKLHQLKEHYGDAVQLYLYLCGYFEPGYLGYEAAEGIDWIWEHRTDDLQQILPESKKKTSSVKETGEEYGVTGYEQAEVTRKAAQDQIDAGKSAEERNRLGQFSTPFELAQQIVVRAVGALSCDCPISFLEPAVGSGVFFSALIRNAEKERINSAIGCEIDASYGRIAEDVWKAYGLKLIHGDFLDYALAPANFGKFTLLCTNPPYVRHHHFSSDVKVRLQSLILQRLGLRPSGLSGLYVYFLLLADAMLAPGGVASWLLPAEFLYVNYGSVLREYLTSRVTLLSIHQFEPDEVQFDDALVSSCVVSYCKKIPARDSRCEFSYGTDIRSPSRVKSITVADLRHVKKWNFAQFEHSNSREEGMVQLGDLVSVRRGIATGANDYFILDEETIAEWKLPRVFLRPILPSPRYVRDRIIEAGPGGAPLVERPRYLLDCTIPPERVRREFPSLWKYLEEGIARGLPERYLCAQREIWYLQERREPAPFLASYMGRTNGNGSCPIRFFVNFSKAIVTNVFLNLYPNRAFADLLSTEPEHILAFGEMLNALPKDDIMQAGRSYGGGLHKIEPKELLGVPMRLNADWLRMNLAGQLSLL